MSPGKLSPLFVGIDLGGTNIKSGVVDDDGRRCHRSACKTQADEVRRSDSTIWSPPATRRSGERRSTGIGSPLSGWVARDHGPRCRDAARSPQSAGLGQPADPRLLADRLKKPVVFQNDGNAAAYGEYWVGAGKGYPQPGDVHAGDRNRRWNRGRTARSSRGATATAASAAISSSRRIMAAAVRAAPSGISRVMPRPRRSYKRTMKL